MEREQVETQIANLKEIESKLRIETNRFHKDEAGFRNDTQLQTKLKELAAVIKERRHLEWSLLSKEERLNHRLQLLESAKKAF